jgi:integrase
VRRGRILRLPSSKHLVGSSCLDGCPVLGPIPVQDLDDEPDVVRNWVRARAKRRQLARNLRRAETGRAQKRSGGDHAVEQYNDTLRRTFSHAGLRLEARLERIDAIPGTRRPKKDQGRGITTEQFSELCRVAWTGGDDPDLDGLLVVFEVCTGARREGILELRTDSLDLAGMQLDLWEKAGSTDWQPVQLQLMGMLIEHVINRHLAVIDPAKWDKVTVDQVLAGEIRLPSGIPIFHYRPKRKDGVLVPHPVTRKRFNTLYDRIQETLPWADQHGVHGHDLRRTGSSWIERRFGRGVSQAWLRHADDVTGSYTRGTREEVRAATDWLGTVIFGDRG